MNAKCLIRVSTLALLGGLLTFAGVAESLAQRGGRSGGGGRSGSSASRGGSSSRSHSSVRQSSPSRSQSSASRSSSRSSASRSSASRSTQRPTQRSRPTNQSMHRSGQQTQRPAQQPGYGTAQRPAQQPGYGTAQRPAQQPGLGTAGPAQRPAQQPGLDQRGPTTPGQRQAAQETLNRRQRDQNVDQAIDTRDQNVDQALDQRNDLAQDWMDQREDIVDSITSPGWRWTSGAVVATLPAGFATVVGPGGTYYYDDGHYLEPVYYGDDVTYVVADPVVGTVVCGGLTADTQILDVNGTTYYLCNGVHYWAYPDGGPDCFEIVNAP